MSHPFSVIFEDTFMQNFKYLETILKPTNIISIVGKPGNFVTGTALSLAKELRKQTNDQCEIVYLHTESDTRVEPLLVNGDLVLECRIPLGMRADFKLEEFMADGLCGYPVFTNENKPRVVILDVHAEWSELLYKLSQQYQFSIIWVSHSNRITETVQLEVVTERFASTNSVALKISSENTTGISTNMLVVDVDPETNLFK